MKPDAAIALSAEQIAFVEGEVTMYVGATAANQSPLIARAIGCRVEADGQVTVFLHAQRAAALIAAVRANGNAAVVFAKPSTHQSLQLKSRTAEIMPISAEDGAFIARYRERIIGHIAALGYAPSVLSTFFSLDADDAIALRLTPCAAFDQTPGPNAGMAIGSAP